MTKRYLALDLGMIMGALGNLLAGDVLRDPFTQGGATTHLRPVVAMEEFHLPRRR